MTETDLNRLRAMARRFDAEAIRYRNYVANADFGCTVISEQMARDAAADASTIRRALSEITPLTKAGDPSPAERRLAKASVE